MEWVFRSTISLNGDFIEECVDYTEYLLDEFETKEEAKKEYNKKFTNEEWGEQIARRGGFKDWAFEICSSGK